MQELGLSKLYKNGKDIKLFCGMTDTLAFLPCEDVKDGMSYLQSVHLDENLVAHFNSTYLLGSFCTIQNPGNIEEEHPPLRLRRVPPMFALYIWNVQSLLKIITVPMTAVNHGTMGYMKCLVMIIHQFGWLLEPFRRIKFWYPQLCFRQHKLCHHRREWQLKFFERD